MICEVCNEEMKSGWRMSSHNSFGYQCWICPNNCLDDNEIVSYDEED